MSNTFGNEVFYGRPHYGLVVSALKHMSGHRVSIPLKAEKNMHLWLHDGAFLWGSINGVVAPVRLETQGDLYFLLTKALKLGLR